MSHLYGPTHRALQDRHGTRRLADRLESLSHPGLDDADRAFVEAAALFFLSTVDHLGRPTVSYKGGAPGFVRVTAPGELAFPSYDGNGMFLSLGNLAASPQVGLLFIDFAHPRRLRVQGTARLEVDDPLLAAYPGADLVVRVALETVFVNCGRYIHPTAPAALSRHVPDAAGRQPFPAWKRIAPLAETLGEADRHAVEAAGGPIAPEDYRGEEPA